MKRMLSATALAALVVLALSGCTGGPAAAPAQSATAAPIPAPNPAQKASLLAEFKKIDPALGEPRNLEDAMQACRLILHDAPEKVQVSKARQILDQAAPGASSNDAAKKVVDAIKANGFCVRS